MNWYVIFRRLRAITGASFLLCLIGAVLSLTMFWNAAHPVNAWAISR
jgi:hypothetical protein